MRGSARLKIDVRPPGFAQGVGGRAHHTGQGLDPVELSESGFRQDSSDGFPQRIVVDRPRQAACKPRGQLLEGHDLQPVSPFPSRLQPQLVHPKQAVGDYCASDERSSTHDLSPSCAKTRSAPPRFTRIAGVMLSGIQSNLSD